MNIKRYILPMAVVIGVVLGVTSFGPIVTLSHLISDFFVRLLKFVSLPIVFLSVVSTLSGFSKGCEVKRIGGFVARYTVLTTVAAATLSLILYELIHPVQRIFSSAGGSLPKQETRYLEEVLKIIPDNIIRPFLEGNVIAIFLMGLVLGISVLNLEESHRISVHRAFQGLFLAVMNLTRGIVTLMPVAVCAFIVLFIQELKGGDLKTEDLMRYLGVVSLSNIFQAVLILPLFLKMKGLSPMRCFRGMFPALSFAFFTKSSAASMPIAIKNAEENLNVTPFVARFSFPLCTTINMNACASFILTTVLFVAEANGMGFSFLEKVLWIFVATLAAIGNAGVPMGCFFLSSALLTNMGVPLAIMGMILPFYAILDAFESAVNVWSDSCVALVVEKDLNLGSKEA